MPSQHSPSNKKEWFHNSPTTLHCHCEHTDCAFRVKYILRDYPPDVDATGLLKDGGLLWTLVEAKKVSPAHSAAS